MSRESEKYQEEQLGSKKGREILLSEWLEVRGDPEPGTTVAGRKHKKATESDEHGKGHEDYWIPDSLIDKV